MQTLGLEQTESLLRCSSYRDFIKSVIELRSRSRSRYGFSDVARAAGFSARSFPRDVATGKKRITPSSLMPFIRGLGLSGDWATYFKLLVEIEEPDCREKIRDEVRLQTMVKNLADRLRRKDSKLPALSKASVVFESHDVPKVYSALGSLSRGATLADIRNRTKLEGEVVKPILKTLGEAGIVRKEKDVYFATEAHLSLPGLKSSEVYKSFYLSLMNEATRKARTDFNSERALFFTSALSVASSDLPRLKEELRSLLLSFADTSEKSDGDSIVSIAASLF